MKTINELKGIVRGWWNHNQTLAQMPEARYFEEQIWDWNSGFKNYTKSEYQRDTSAFQLLRVKDIKGGLAIHLKSGVNEIDGILDTKSGVWHDKVGGNDTQTLTFIGARIGNE